MLIGTVSLLTFVYLFLVTSRQPTVLPRLDKESLQTSCSNVTSLSNAQALVDTTAMTNAKGDAAKAGGDPSGKADDEEYGQDVVYPVERVEWSDNVQFWYFVRQQAK